MQHFAAICVLPGGGRAPRPGDRVQLCAIPVSLYGKLPHRARHPGDLGRRAEADT